MTALGDRLGKTLADMLAWRESVGYATATYRYTLAGFFEFVGGLWPEEPAVTAGMVDAWLAHRGYANANSQAIFVSCLREFSRFSRFEGNGDFVPGEEYGVGREAYQPYVFTDEELSALFLAVDSYVGRTCGRRYLPELVLPVWTRLLYCCGMRPGEPPSLLAGDVDLSGGDVRIRQTKRHRDRHIIMSEDMRALCERYDSLSRAGRTWFFELWDGRPYTTGWYYERWRAIVASCGVAWRGGPPRPYDLRHQFASRNIVDWMDAGRDVMGLLPALSAYMGHSELGSTLYYIHMLPERLRRSPGVDWSALSEAIGAEP